LHQATTDAQGLARLPGSSRLLSQRGVAEDDFIDSYRSQRLVVVVERAGDMAVVDGNWSQRDPESGTSACRATGRGA